jgi:3-oxoacyl-[acyl-carrier-protein] synthase-3
MHATIVGIEYFLPESTLTSEDLCATFPEWDVKKIEAKTGIRTRHVAADSECASDLAVAAARKMFESRICDSKDVDFLLCCTQSPDYLLPTTACLLQDRLGIPVSAGALDFNLGCSGFVYGLGLAEGLIASGQAKLIVLITADTYSKYIKRTDKACRTIFGDGAAATLISGRQGGTASMGPFIYGTDGRGGKNLIVPNSATRRSYVAANPGVEVGATYCEQPFLFMDGSQLFTFAVTTVPQSVKELLEKADMTVNDVDLFVFHQANAFILEETRRILQIPKEKFQLTLADSANTVSSTIPIALKHAEIEGRLPNGANVLVAGFGVGYSWAATIVRWVKTN